MKLREFIIKFETVCKQYGYLPAQIWADMPMDELQWLIDEGIGEWEALANYLSLGIKPGHTNTAPYPELHCKTCLHFKKSFCAKWQKTIPETFNQAQACSQWNEI